MSEADLDSPESYSGIDPDDMYRRVNELPEQMEDAWDLAGEVRIPAEYRNASSVVIAGMGGSAIGGSLIEAYGAGDVRVSVSVWRNYGLPGFVHANTLLIVASYSGNTEETLSAMKAGRERGAMLLAITTGGEVGKMAERWDVPTMRFEYDAQPRATLGYLFVPLVRLFQELGFLPNQESAFHEALRVARQAREALNEEVGASRNPAKQLARDVFGKEVIVYGAGYLAPVARRWKTQLNENSKNWAFYEEFPELNHNAIVGYEYPISLTGSIGVVVLSGSHYLDRIKRRIQVTEQLMDEYGVGRHRLEATGESPLAQMIWLIALGDYVSYYLALLNGADPTTIKPIHTLKAALAQI